MDGNSLNIYSVVPSNLMPEEIQADRLEMKVFPDGTTKAWFYVGDEIVGYYREPEILTLEVIDDELIGIDEDTELDEEEDE